MHYSIETILFILAAYLIGSIPFGLILGKIFGKGDIRQQGSGNIGATNALRVGGKKVGILTLLFDGLKGMIIIYAARVFSVDHPGLAVFLAEYCLIAVIIGHCFSIFLGFKGGKGVATLLFSLIIYYYPLAIACASIWIIVYMMSKISSLSSLIMALSMPLIAFILSNKPGYVIGLLCIISAIILIRHHENIKRLIKGEEKKI